MKFSKRSSLILLIPILAICFFSCKTQKPVQYFDGAADTSKMHSLTIPETVIQKGDLISIIVYSDNPEATAIYNQQMSSASVSTSSLSPGAALTGVMGSSSQSLPGYFVNDDGNIPFQSLGILHVEGLTKVQLEQMLKDKLSTYLKNPYFSIRFLNYKITVLGEVNHPSVYSIASERVNILEALGMAGDMSIYGLKENVTVIRESNGKREFGVIDVSKPEAALSPYYYLRQNDIVIVRANPKKPSVSEQVTLRNLTIASTLATIVTSLGILYSIFKK